MPRMDGNLETSAYGRGRRGKTKTLRQKDRLIGRIYSAKNEVKSPIWMELLNGVLRSCGTPFCDLRGGHLQFERRELRKGEICMELIASINSAINGFVWGVPMLVLLVGGGILLTIRNRGVQFRKFGYAMKNTIGKIFKKGEAKEGEITPFQAMSTALAGTVGTGNIAGITTAVTLGGPGTIFWLWITALIGMATKYSEVLLAVKFREKNKYGDWVGGPMYYIKNGLGKNWKWLGAIFCIFAALAAFGIGNAVQVGNITDSVNTVILSFNPDFSGQSTVNVVLGLILVVLTAIVLFGGIKRLGAVTEKLVPFMAVVYIVACVIVLVYYGAYLPAVFSKIFTGAFSPEGVTGGAVGSVILVITWGVKRGVFSNEAGLGSAPMAHAASSTDEPAEQAMWGVFEVFVDTIVICTITSLTVLLSGLPLGEAALDSYTSNGTAAVAAFNTILPGTIGGVVIQISLLFFALSTILGWSYYGEQCWGYLTHDSKMVKALFKAVFALVCIVGATGSGKLMWDIADTLNGMMAIPNLVGLLALSGVVARITRDYFKER